MKKSSILEARRKLVNPEVRKKVDLAFQIIDRNYEILMKKGLKQEDLAINKDFHGTKIEDKIAFIIAAVTEFSARFSLNPQQAYRYLDRFKGIDFLDEFYSVEHTQSFDDVVDDLALLCRKNGGALE